MHYNKLEDLNDSEILRLYENTAENSSYIAETGVCDCNTFWGVSRCYFETPTDEMWNYSRTYYTVCDNDAKGYGTWDRGYCEYAVCRYVANSSLNSERGTCYCNTWRGSSYCDYDSPTYNYSNATRAYYTVCSNGVRAYGTWDRGNCEYAVCRYVERK